ncbi:conserved hypothetical protein [Escherichia coli HS]|nr:conserved hypothetical protein [Escherichia coli HS]
MTRSLFFLFQSDFLLRNRFQLRSQAVDTFGTQQRSPLVLFGGDHTDAFSNHVVSLPIARLGVFTPLEVQTHRRTAIRVNNGNANRHNGFIAQRLFWRNLIGLTVIHRQRLPVSLLQVLTESGKVGFTLSRGRTLVILAQHQRTGVFHLYVWQQFLINNGTQIIRVGPNLRLLILQAIERFLRRLVHQLIRIGLVCRGCRTQRCNHQQSDHH